MLCGYGFLQYWLALRLERRSQPAVSAVCSNRAHRKLCARAAVIAVTIGRVTAEVDAIIGRNLRGAYKQQQQQSKLADE